MFLQSTLAAYMSDDLRRQTLWWLDNIIIVSETISDHISVIRHFLQFFLDYNFWQHLGKSTLNATFVRWSGRLIGPDGLSFDPRRFDGIHNMACTRTGSELQ